MAHTVPSSPFPSGVPLGAVPEQSATLDPTFPTAAGHPAPGTHHQRNSDHLQHPPVATMSPRRGQGLNGLDPTPIVTHYLFLVTSVLAFVRRFRFYASTSFCSSHLFVQIGWLTAFIGQAAFEAKFKRGLHYPRLRHCLISLSSHCRDWSHSWNPLVCHFVSARAPPSVINVETVAACT